MWILTSLQVAPLILNTTTNNYPGAGNRPTKRSNNITYHIMKTTSHNIKYETSVKSTNVYQIITDRIVEQLSKGIVPWRKPWVGGSAMAVKYTSGEPYSMLNQLLLGKPGEWLSWGLIQKLGGKVKKGAKSSMCVWTKTEAKNRTVLAT